jgi:hypothetical protein
MTILRNVQHRGDRIVRDVFTTDGYGRDLGTRDTDLTLLSAVPSGKVLALGTVFNGLRVEFDEHIDPYEEYYVTGFMPGNRLVSPPADKVLNLGLVIDGYKGALRRFKSKVSDAVAAADYAADERAGRPVVDITGLCRAVDASTKAMGALRVHDSRQTVQRAISDSVRSLRHEMNNARPTQVQRSCLDSGPAAAELSRRNAQFWADGGPGVARWQPELPAAPSAPMRRRTPGSGSKPISPADLNRRNAEFWADPSKVG